MTSVVWTCQNSENNFGIKHKFEKKMEMNCRNSFDEQLSFKHFLKLYCNIALVRYHQNTHATGMNWLNKEYIPKIAIPFLRCRYETWIGLDVCYAFTLKDFHNLPGSQLPEASISILQSPAVSEVNLFMPTAAKSSPTILVKSFTLKHIWENT